MDRFEVINQMIKWDKGYASHKVNADDLRIDFFQGRDKYYLEAGVAYLEGKLSHEQVEGKITPRLERLNILWENDLFKRSQLIVEIGGTVNNGNDCEYLDFTDGFHRTIYSMYDRDSNLRYWDIKKKTELPKLKKQQKRRMEEESKFMEEYFSKPFPSFDELENKE